jgi:hypothetical protein
MVTKKKGLGRGLENLLGPQLAEPGEATLVPTSLPLERLQPGKYQPRTRMDEGALYELAESIRAQGVMQPELVRPVGPPEAGRYESIAGERRFRAARHDPAEIRRDAGNDAVDVGGIEGLAETAEQALQFRGKRCTHMGSPQALRKTSGRGTVFFSRGSYQTRVAYPSAQVEPASTLRNV